MALSGIPVIGVFFTPALWFWVAIYAVITLSLNLEAGLTGIPNFGRHLAVITGAIVGAVVPGYLGLLMLPDNYRAEIASLTGLPPANVTPGLYSTSYNSIVATELTKYYASNPGISFAVFLVTLITAAVLGALVGAAVAYPAARLREDYLAITMLAAGEAALIIAYNAGVLGGTQGLTVPNTLAWLDKLFSPLGEQAHMASSLFIVLLLLALIYAYMELLVRSPAGRLLKGVRENDIAAEALGKDTAKIRLKTLMMGSAIAAVAGSVFIMWTLGWIATTYNRVSWTFWPWAMMILGGPGNNLGVLVGAFILASARQLITFNKDLIAPFLPFDPVWLDPIILGLIIILVLLLAPEGLLPEKTIYPLPREKLEKIAQRFGAPKEKKAVADRAALD
jgi:branched-chain amino acid transport system permease protein